MTTIRKGQAPAPLTRAEFHERFATRFYDPAFAVEADAIARLEEIAWDALQEGRKAPVTRPAGRGFADPAYEVSVQWLDTRQFIGIFDFDKDHETSNQRATRHTDRAVQRRLQHGRWRLSEHAPQNTGQRLGTRVSGARARDCITTGHEPNARARGVDPARK